MSAYDECPTVNINCPYCEGFRARAERAEADMTNAVEALGRAHAAIARVEALCDGDHIYEGYVRIEDVRDTLRDAALRGDQ